MHLTPALFLSRVLSLYYFCRAQNRDQFPIFRRARELDLDEFLHAGVVGSDSLVELHVWNHQTCQLAQGWNRSVRSVPIAKVGRGRLLDLARANAKEFSYIGFTETVDEDCDTIFAALGMPPVAHLPKSNVTRRRLAYSALSSRTRELLQQLTALDRQLYAELWAHRHSQARSGSDALSETTI